MNYLKRANVVLGDAETGLKKLLSEAAESADYTVIEALVSLARQLGDLQNGHQNWKGPPTAGDAVSPEPLGEKASSRHASNGRSTALVKPSPKNRTQKRTKKKYPRFARAGDTLVKIAWSKSTKSEYKHKSPKFIVDVLSDAIVRLANEFEVISMDKILPLKSVDGSEIPDYQAYLCLAWLRNVELVAQKGREGYSIDNPETLVNRIASAWDEMPAAS